MTTAVQRLVILGATGSIGASTLDVVARHPNRFSVFALTAHRQWRPLAALCLRFSPRFAVLADETSADFLRTELRNAGCATQVLGGVAALCEMAAHPEADVVMAAIVGAAGLVPNLAAVRAGKKVLLANKEALVLSGQIFMEALAQSKATLLPIDSEHNAIFQCLPAGYAENPAHAGVRRILLTASGGPFRDTPLAALETVTPEQACAHPKWVMGRKISVDSATMMNKGLEVIEAHWLFGVPPERIEVVIHPQSVVHSMVDYVDGSVLAQMGNPDMRVPIAQALAWPERIDSGAESLDCFNMESLSFERPDLKRFPCLRLAFDALHAGGTAPAVLNAANEEAVSAFLEKRIAFTAIARVVATCLECADIGWADSLESVLEADAWSRERARAAIAGMRMN